jgi:hypothetical protein
MNKKHLGRTLDDLLRVDSLLNDVTATAIKRVMPIKLSRK